VKEWTAANKDKLRADTMRKLAPLLEDPEFRSEVMEKKSMAATELCLWVHALKLYYDTNIIVEKKNRSARLPSARSKRQLPEIEAT
jgi:hypothetical protein